MLEEEEDDDLLVYCMGGGCSRHSEVKESILTDGEVTFRHFFRVSNDIFSFIVNKIKEGTTPSCDQSSDSCMQLVVYKKYKCHKLTPAPPTCCYKTSVLLHRSQDLDAAGPALCTCRTLMSDNI
jgi:hypothetical protein